MFPFFDFFASTNGVHFTEALAQNAAELEALSPEMGFAAGHARGIVRALTVISSQNLAWELRFYDNPDGRSPDPNLDGFLGFHAFTSGDGLQVGGAGLYYYFEPLLEIPVIDLTRSSRVFVELVNRSQPGKVTYGAGSHFRMRALVQRVST